VEIDQTLEAEKQHLLLEVFGENFTLLGTVLHLFKPAEEQF
jgi:hypothetical protein